MPLHERLEPLVDPQRQGTTVGLKENMTNGPGLSMAERIFVGFGASVVLVDSLLRVLR